MVTPKVSFVPIVPNCSRVNFKVSVRFQKKEVLVDVVITAVSPALPAPTTNDALVTLSVCNVALEFRPSVTSVGEVIVTVVCALTNMGNNKITNSIFFILGRRYFIGE